MIGLSQAVAGRIAYLSGPISGLDPAYASEAFASAERACRKAGAAAVFNPMDDRRQANRKGWTHAQHMCADLHAMTHHHKGDGVPDYVLVRLPGWSASRGATIEDAVAAAIGMERYDLGAQGA